MINRSQRELEHNPINPRNGCDVRRWRLSARIGCVARPPRAATCRTSSRSASDRQSQGFAQNVMRVLSASAHIGELISLVHTSSIDRGRFQHHGGIRDLTGSIWRPARRTKTVGCPAGAAPVTPRLVRHPAPSPNRPIAGRCQSLPRDRPALGGHNIIYGFMKAHSMNRGSPSPNRTVSRTRGTTPHEGFRSVERNAPCSGLFLSLGVRQFCGAQLGARGLAIGL